MTSTELRFEPGDIVQVEYHSVSAIENWMKSWVKVGPGDVGVVKYGTSVTLHNHGDVTVTFPMIGTFAVHSTNLKLVQKAVPAEDIAKAVRECSK